MGRCTATGWAGRGAVVLALWLGACERGGPPRLTISGSALGPEAVLLRQQVTRFMAAHPELPVELRVTPDAADQRHQLYVQWLNAQAPDPDVLQLDVVWTAEFAGAGWIDPIEPADEDDFLPAAVAAARWRGRTFALPWFVDVGLLYWRRDLLPSPPDSQASLAAAARAAQSAGRVRYGLVWQGARYEGLVTVFVEYLGAFGGGILDDRGDVIVDRPAAVRALAAMCDAVGAGGYVPRSALTWQEEQVRFAFQNGQALFMRNWPYAYALLQDPATSRVDQRFGVTAFPAGDDGAATVALGGAQLAVNARSRHRAAAAALVRFLTAREQMAERLRVIGQLPARRSAYEQGRTATSLPLAQLESIVARAVPRPVTPVYSELSDILQVHLHRALSGQQEPATALTAAAAEIRTLLARSGLTPAGE